MRVTSNMVRRLYYHLLLGPRGYGRPVAREVVEAEYETGYWDYLHSLVEMPRYMIVAGYLDRLHKNPSVLDVGCGHCYLLQLLNAFGFARYHGLDLSTKAIEQASNMRIDNATFEVTNFEDWASDMQYDAIVFSESLYHAANPTEMLLRYSRWLKPNGSFVVSMFRRGHRGAI